MNLFYFIQKYLDKQDDISFRIKWEKFVHNKIKRFITVILFIWLFGSVGFGYLIILLIGGFFGFILLILVSIYLGYILFIQTIKFLAVNNTRYIQGSTNINENVFNYDDIVE